MPEVEDPSAIARQQFTAQHVPDKAGTAGNQSPLCHDVPSRRSLVDTLAHACI